MIEDLDNVSGTPIPEEPTRDAFDPIADAPLAREVPPVIEE